MGIASGERQGIVQRIGVSAEAVATEIIQGERDYCSRLASGHYPFYQKDRVRLTLWSVED